uniref:40S ribosomal protein S7 n=1 Tax=Strombidium inclinatum TaxID=197538 RepID=A0A7S3IRM5_9SPIT|mmetsp:Transcript_31573/g.48265  ORF Transcript_31573/g.48265 Transcript_31573/m.48265 type:complete len:209 (+) Transcript_31573:95-721(+)|eukprot:CAMPEP_0170478832 /NCGR_PEP_ID=MMETSP0208-20121228/275_1 /TAXON_ID=197538 /ORGANISM="Strombidium inclinatum, Strain S3" /LENGTH=208 /DNA_ID=CAMNT_0010751151 /DNA_START=45 /DNA_END=671 /DNA_ORIENTATION=+
MFNRRDKIIKKDGSKPTDLEEDVAKAISSLESSNKAQKAHLSIIFINSVENVQFEQADHTSAEYLLVRIPHRSHGAFKKVGGLVQEKLEQSFEKPVIVVANRTIISPSAIHHPSQMRPRSRTLTAVHKEILNDVVFPSNISGRSTRVTLDGKQHQKVLLDPLDKEIIENKVDAIVHCYHKITTHKIALGFSKPTHFQQKIIDSRAAKN